MKIERSTRAGALVTWSVLAMAVTGCSQNLPGGAAGSEDSVINVGMIWIVAGVVMGLAVLCFALVHFAPRHPLGAEKKSLGAHANPFWTILRPMILLAAAIPGLYAFALMTAGHYRFQQQAISQPVGNPDRTIAISSDGRFVLAGARDGTAYVFPFDRPLDLRATIDMTSDPALAFEVDPVSGAILIARESGQVQLVSGEAVQSIDSDLGEGAISPLIAFGDQGEWAVVQQAANGQSRITSDNQAAFVGLAPVVSLTSAGKGRFVMASADGALHVANVTTTPITLSSLGRTVNLVSRGEARSLGSEPSTTSICETLPVGARLAASPELVVTQCQGCSSEAPQAATSPSGVTTICATIAAQRSSAPFGAAGFASAELRTSIELIDENFRLLAQPRHVRVEKDHIEVFGTDGSRLTADLSGNALTNFARLAPDTRLALASGVAWTLPAPVLGAARANPDVTDSAINRTATSEAGLQPSTGEDEDSTDEVAEAGIPVSQQRPIPQPVNAGAGLISCSGMRNTSSAPASQLPDRVPSAQTNEGTVPVLTQGGKYASIVIDCPSGRVLHDREADTVRRLTSVAKVMTLYLVFEEIRANRLAFETPLKVSAYASKQQPSKLGLKSGSQIIVDSAIRAMVTKSANDVAVVLAEAISGTEAKFAVRMNQKARELGMTSTRFANASGLPTSEGVTTARDLAKLADAVISDFPEFYHYFSIPDFTWNKRKYANHNTLLLKTPGVDGLKTGFTNAGGYSLMATAQRGGRRIFVVMLGGSSGNARDQHVEDLIEAAFLEPASPP